VEEDLEETVEVAGGALIFESDGVALLPRQIWHGEVVRAVAGLPFPAGLHLTLLLTGEQVLLSVEHIIKHYQRFINTSLTIILQISINSQPKCKIAKSHNQAYIL
jgi:hypothetical protein